MKESMDILIKPEEQTISTVIGSFDEYHEYIKELIDVQMFTFVRLYENGDGVYIDDEGLYAQKRHFWIHRNYPHPLVNKGLFVGVDEAGETVPASTGLPQLEKDIVWIGDDHDIMMALKFSKAKIDTGNGHEDYRPIFFGE